MVKNPPSDDTKLEEQCNNPIKQVDKYRFAVPAELYLAAAKKGKDQLDNIRNMNLNESWTMFAAMDEFPQSTGRELDFFNRFASFQSIKFHISMFKCLLTFIASRGVRNNIQDISEVFQIRQCQIWSSLLLISVSQC